MSRAANVGTLGICRSTQKCLLFPFSYSQLDFALKRDIFLQLAVKEAVDEQCTVISTNCCDWLKILGGDSNALKIWNPSRP